MLSTENCGHWIGLSLISCGVLPENRPGGMASELVPGLGIGLVALSRISWRKARVTACSFLAVEVNQ